MTLALEMRKILHILILSTENRSKYSDAKELASLTLGKTEYANQFDQLCCKPYLAA